MAHLACYEDVVPMAVLLGVWLQADLLDVLGACHHGSQLASDAYLMFLS